MTISTRKARRIRRYLTEGAHLAALGVSLNFIWNAYKRQPEWQGKIVEVGYLNEATKGYEL
jgi:hypothetical protein